MELEVNRTYTLQEMKDFFGVTDDVWKKNKDELLRHLSNYYDYEVKYCQTDRRKREYFIVKKNAEYEEYKKPKREKTVLRDTIFEENIVDIVKNDNINTSANINRIMRKDVEFIRDNYTEGTSYEYTRIRMIEYFGKSKNEGGTKGKIIGKVWCKCDMELCVYIPLPKEVMKDFYKMLNKTNNENVEEVAEMCSDYENGLITKDDRDKGLGYINYKAFENSKKEFFVKYGYYPICVPIYEFNAFNG